MDCVVHIGAEKTGSTSIQFFMSENRGELPALGFWYPRTFIGPRGRQHSELVRAMTNESVEDDGSFAAEMRAAEAAGARTAIISSEHLHSGFIEPVHAERLRTFLMRYFERIRIVYYARRQDLTVASLHSGALKNLRLTERDATQASAWRPVRYFDHLAIADYWSTAFDRHALICRVFDPARLIEGDVVADLCTAIGLERPPGATAVRRNPSYTLEGMAAMIRLNETVTKENETNSCRRVRRAVIRAARFGEGTRVPTMTRAMAMEFYSRFADSNRVFFETYVDPAYATSFGQDFDMFPLEPPRWPTDAEADRFITEAVHNDPKLRRR